MLAQDHWPQVAAEATGVLGRIEVGEAVGRSPGRIVLAWPFLRSLLEKQLDGLSAGVCGSHEKTTTLARLLSGSMALAGPARTVAVALSVGRRSLLCKQLVRVFEVSVPGHLRIADAGQNCSQDCTSSLRFPPFRNAHLTVLTSEEVRVGAALRCTSLQRSLSLPKTYGAASGLVRILARAATVTGGDALASFTGASQLCATQFCGSLSSSDEILHTFRSSLLDKPPGWQLVATSAILLLSEVIFGASGAWHGLQLFAEDSQWVKPSYDAPAFLVSVVSEILTEAIRPEVLAVGVQPGCPLKFPQCLTFPQTTTHPLLFADKH